MVDGRKEPGVMLGSQLGAGPTRSKCHGYVSLLRDFFSVVVLIRIV